MFRPEIPYSVSFNDNDNDDNESRFIVKIVQNSKPNNQLCKYMIHHKNIVKW